MAELLPLLPNEPKHPPMTDLGTDEASDPSLRPNTRASKALTLYQILRLSTDLYGDEWLPVSAGSMENDFWIRETEGDTSRMSAESEHVFLDYDDLEIFLLYLMLEGCFVFEHDRFRPTDSFIEYLRQTFDIAQSEKLDSLPGQAS